MHTLLRLDGAVAAAPSPEICSDTVNVLRNHLQYGRVARRTGAYPHDRRSPRERLDRVGVACPERDQDEPGDARERDARRRVGRLRAERGGALAAVAADRPG